MSFCYLWSPKENREHREENTKVFRRIIEENKNFMESVFGKKFSLNYTNTPSSFLGSIGIDIRPSNTPYWHEYGERGVIFSGICETYIGQSSDRLIVEDVFRRIQHDRTSIQELSGRFTCVAFDREKDNVYVFNGATEQMTFWYTKSDRGVAVGSRGSPLLEFTRQKKMLNESTAKAFLEFGYIFGFESMYQNVFRLRPRNLLTISKNGNFKSESYCSLSSYFSSAQRLSLSQVVEKSCIRLLKRMDNQYSCDPNVELLLTGGKDSRLIAAAFKNLSDDVVSFTGGNVSSNDCQVADSVSRQLGFKHILTGDQGSINIVNRRLLSHGTDWSMLSEGMETIRHFLSLSSETISDDKKNSLFHGLGGELRRGYYHPIVAESRLDKKGSAIDLKKAITGRFVHKKMDSELTNVIDSWFDYLAEEIEDFTCSFSQLLDIHYWLNRHLHWGQDMMSVKHPIQWRWTPLYDRDLLLLSWNLPRQVKSSSTLPIEMTNKLAPELQEIPYGPSGNIKLRYQYLRKFVPEFFDDYVFKLKYRKPDLTDVEISLRNQWLELFASENDLVEHLFNKKLRNTLVDLKPNDEKLWNLATIVLFKKALDSS